jgi:hypothetical protein
MSDAPIFSRKLLLAFIGFAIGAFALSLWLMGREDYGADHFGPSSHSTSALGYAGIAEVLKDIGVPVIKSRRNPAVQAQSGVLIVAEPQMHLLPQAGTPVLPDAEKILLVLPKWRGERRNAEKRNWIGNATAVFSLEILRVLGLALDKPQIERREKTADWTGNAIGVPPGLSGRVQLIKSDELKPLVATQDGVLLGEIRKDDRLIWVLADPDVMANHALNPDGGGAEFAVALIEKLRDGDGPVVFDETVHGFQSLPSATLRLLLQFPYSIIALQIAMAALLVLWATTGRFGPPETPPPALGAGKARLIGNVADLMEFAGHERLIVQRYVENTVRDTARQLHAPRNLSPQQTLEWLSNYAKRRNIASDCAAIARMASDLAASKGRIDAARFADAARQIYQWKQELLDGPSTHKQHH